jgi:hypothetical protein
MAAFDQFANQGGAAAGDAAEAAEALATAAALLKESAPAANAADFGGGPLGSLPDESAASASEEATDDEGSKGV